MKASTADCGSAVVPDPVPVPPPPDDPPEDTGVPTDGALGYPNGYPLKSDVLADALRRDHQKTRAMVVPPNIMMRRACSFNHSVVPTALPPEGAPGGPLL